MFQVMDAKRDQRHPKIAISGASGSGKTATSLLILNGMGAKWEEIGVIDTEKCSSALYAESKPRGISQEIGKFKIIPFDAPYSIDRYIEAVRYAKSIGIKYLIIDSLSHSWMGEGGALDKVNDITASSRGGNSYVSWKTVTPLFSRMINDILDYPGAVIVTLRSKQEYSQEVNPTTGKREVKKIGMAPLIRDGIEYEFDTVFDIDLSHFGRASKDRTGVFSDQQLIMDAEIGRLFEKWRQGGSVTAPSYHAVMAEQSMAQKPAETHPTVNPNLSVALNGSLSGNLSGDLGGSLNSIQSAPAATQTIADPFSQPQALNQPVVPQNIVISDLKPLAEECSRFLSLTKQYDLAGDVSKAMCRKALGLGDNDDLQFKNLTAEQINKCYHYCLTQLSGKPVVTEAAPQVQPIVQQLAQSTVAPQTQVLSGVLF